MKSKDHEDQLNEFFKHHPVDDPNYLKRYVQEHPNNKMAWYLLGREYTAKGKHGKALYCYTQAGEVYEAFEKKAAPVLELQEDNTESVDRRRRASVWTRAAVMVLSLVLTAVLAPYAATSPERNDSTPAAAPSQASGASVYYLVPEKSKTAVSSAIQEMLEKERLGRYGILVNGIRTTDKHWVQWLLPPIALLSVDGRADGAQQRIMYHDAQSCECQPTDPGSVAEMITPWQQEKEQEAILRAGLASYYQRNGVMPEALEELNKPYPANVLPGVTTYMQARYEQAKAVLQTAAKANLDVPGAGAAGSLGLTSSAGSSMQPPLTEPLAQPLQIIVDKSNHRLALVSGSVIIRSYPVGLGGAKTPEGQFAITEKVRNPNGKSNGDFGSRGMTLSDTLYAIHGTNKPGSVGRDQSLGCVRMLQEDVEELFDMVPLGTKVTIGKALLPNETLKSGNPFKMPLFSEETNPKKVYKWLD